MMTMLLLGVLIGWVCSFVYGWNRRAYYEHKAFHQGYRLGRQNGRNA